MQRFLAGAMAAMLMAVQAWAQPAPPAPIPAPAPVPIPAPSAIQPAWVARATAELQILDKVNARATVQSVAVGGNIRVGPLTIAVQVCSARPPDQAPDAAAYLLVTETGAGTGAEKILFRGWMFAANPMISIFEHPIYDMRVVNCRP